MSSLERIVSPDNHADDLAPRGSGRAIDADPASEPGIDDTAASRAVDLCTTLALVPSTVEMPATTLSATSGALPCQLSAHAALWIVARIGVYSRIIHGLPNLQRADLTPGPTKLM